MIWLGGLSASGNTWQPLSSSSNKVAGVSVLQLDYYALVMEDQLGTKGDHM